MTMKKTTNVMALVLLKYNIFILLSFDHFYYFIFMSNCDSVTILIWKFTKLVKLTKLNHLKAQHIYNIYFS